MGSETLFVLLQMYEKHPRPLDTVTITWLLKLQPSPPETTPERPNREVQLPLLWYQHAIVFTLMSMQKQPEEDSLVNPKALSCIEISSEMKTFKRRRS